jgi:hypothetical protein
LARPRGGPATRIERAGAEPFQLARGIELIRRV